MSEPAVKKEPYLGSVRFFKHIFLGILIAMILVPTVSSVVLFMQVSGLKGTQAQLNTQLETAQQALAQARLEAEQAAAEIEAAQATPLHMLSTILPDNEQPDYTRLYPDFYAPEADYASVAAEMTCYLTFDDGPSPRTDEVLAVLEKEDVKATFFVTKQDTEANRARLRRVARAGHTIGLHTATHKYTEIYASVDAFLADYYELYSWIVDVTGEKPTVYRFPGGSINSYNQHIYQEIIAEMTRRGFVYFDWNVSSGDATSAVQPAARLTNNCLDGLNKFSRAVVLMHDSSARSTTVEALPAVIGSARALGFSFAPLTSEVKPVIFGYKS